MFFDNIKLHFVRKFSVSHCAQYIVRQTWVSVSLNMDMSMSSPLVLKVIKGNVILRRMSNCRCKWLRCGDDTTEREIWDFCGRHYCHYRFFNS